MSILKTPILYLKGVGPERANVISKYLEIFTFQDLLEYFPYRYIDKSVINKSNQIVSEEEYYQIRGIVTSISENGFGKNKRLHAIVKDSFGSVELIWFQNYSFFMSKLQVGVELLAFGKPSFFRGSPSFSHPDIEFITAGEDISTKLRFLPLYNSGDKLKKRGLDSNGIRKLITALFAQLKTEGIPENLSEQIIQENNLVSRWLAYVKIHFPDNQNDVNEAKKRIAFEEFFFTQINFLHTKKENQLKNKGIVFPSVGYYFNEYYTKHLSFELTNAQKRVIKEIRNDVKSGIQMNRLVQGDVGSGKTIVAFFTMLMAIDNQYQACLIAPTEILAIQHYNSLSNSAFGLNINIKLLTGSTKTSERNIIKNELKEGTLNILIGTHALLEDWVSFVKLGLVVIDEQHKFGVAQRAKLWDKNKGNPPHILVMTATPIPRTLALTLYGDLDFSVIDELPPGRKPIITKHVYSNQRLKLNGFIREQIRLGRQIYFVYPLIDESENLDLMALQNGLEAIGRDFPEPDYHLSMVHGRLSPTEKEYEMKRFKKGETHIMVATTVIEVGVDVPNATVMIIENAERFGLSQLHQLRGRVGRGGEQSYCFLVTPDDISFDSRKRMKVMVASNDGFYIAEEDMKLRGPGDITGTQQSGVIQFKVANIITDSELLIQTRLVAQKLLENDWNLNLPENQAIKSFLINEHKDGSKNWIQIS